MMLRKIPVEPPTRAVQCQQSQQLRGVTTKGEAEAGALGGKGAGDLRIKRRRGRPAAAAKVSAAAYRRRAEEEGEEDEEEERGISNHQLMTPVTSKQVQISL